MPSVRIVVLVIVVVIVERWDVAFAICAIH